MASIRKRVSESGVTKYHVSIRKKGQTISASFNDMETAKLFAHIKEKVIDEMEAFEIKPKDLIRLKDGFQIKMEDAQEENLSSHTIQDIKKAYDFFSLELGEDFYLNDLTYEKIKEITEKLFKVKVCHGGDRKDFKNYKLPSASTVRRNLASISSIYGTLIKKGINIRNPFQEFLTYFHTTYMKK